MSTCIWKENELEVSIVSLGNEPGSALPSKGTQVGSPAKLIVDMNVPTIAVVTVIEIFFNIFDFMDILLIKEVA
jgi:hypothetical protein